MGQMLGTVLISLMLWLRFVNSFQGAPRVMNKLVRSFSNKFALSLADEDSAVEPDAPRKALSDNDERVSLKAKLFAATSTCDRGLGFASKGERTEIDLMIRQLCENNPTEVPTSGLVGSENYKYGEECLLAGRWKLVYTDAVDVVNLAASPVTALRGIYQEINANGDSSNVIDFAPRTEALLPPSVGFRSTLRARVKTFSRARSDSRVGLTFLGIALEPQSLLGYDVSHGDGDGVKIGEKEQKAEKALPFGLKLPKASFDFPRLSMFGADNNNANNTQNDTQSDNNKGGAGGYFDVRYVDEDTLIIYQNEPGGVFVNSRVVDSDW